MVVSLLAIVGGAIVYSMTGIRSKVAEDLSNAEVSTVYEAIKKFRRDTGYYPKQGPFALTSFGGEIDPGNADHWPAFCRTKKFRRADQRFNHPANFYQLVLGKSPLESTGHALESFSIQTGRGWRGPI